MAGKGSRHRFELSRLEIVGLLASAAGGLFVVFVLGMYAGHGMVETRAVGADQIVRVPVSPAAEQSPAAEDELTFYDALAGDRDSRPADERGAPRAAVAPTPAGRVPLPAPDVGSLLAEQAGARAGDGDAAAEAARAPAVPVPPAPRGAAALYEAAESRGLVASPAPQRPDARAVVAHAGSTKPAAPNGAWSVQVSATRDQRTADEMMRRLKGKGYEAYVVKMPGRGETFYRVRVGHYPSLELANQAVSRLRREPGIPSAFVASD